jgi:Leucine-rich repeat (LRR) protein
LLCHQWLGSCGDRSKIPLNFTCNQEEIYDKCSLRDVSITMTDKNSTFIVGNFSESTKGKMIDVEIERSSLTFVPAEIFKQISDVRQFVARRVGIEEIHADTFSAARKLRYLTLSFNKIIQLFDVSFKDASDLEVLKLDNNRISNLSAHTFFGLKQLRILNLSSNQIAYLPLLLFRDLESLESLMLDKNQIRVISHDQFQGNRVLHQLFLEDNTIVTIDDGSFDNFNEYLEVDLRENICTDNKFSPWHHANFTKLDCCSGLFEQMERCLQQKVKGDKNGHLTLIFILFVSFFINFFAIGYFLNYRNRTQHQLDAENIELFAEQNGSAYQVY